jgi:hypothetical protein
MLDFCFENNVKQCKKKKAIKIQNPDVTIAEKLHFEN